MISRRIMHLFIVFIVAIPMQSSFGENIIAGLTDKNIKAFLESVPEVREWNKQETEAAAKQKPIDNVDYGFSYFDRSSSASSYEAVLMSTRDPYLAGELKKLVGKYGFASLDEWIYTGERLSNAYLAVHGTFASEEGRKQLNAAAETISMDTVMPSGYQDIMMAIIGSAQAAVAEIDEISPEEKALVKRNLPVLKSMFDEQ